MSRQHYHLKLRLIHVKATVCSLVSIRIGRKRKRKCFVNIDHTKFNFLNSMFLLVSFQINFVKNQDL